jgi:predicted CxxxxCH...CXXCH cytochrome family protein
MSDPPNGNLPTKHINNKVDVSFITKFGGNYNGSPNVGDGYSYCSNTYCHSNGTSVATSIVTTNSSPTWGNGAMECTGCHGYPPVYPNGSPKANTHGRHTFGCNSCHFGTTADGLAISSKTLHVNKTYNLAGGAGATFIYTFSNNGGSCGAISCHGSTNAQWGSTSCLGCHSVAQGGRAAIAGQFSASSHHIQGEVTDAKCSQCHWEANQNGTINPLYHGGSVSPGAPVDLVIFGTTARPESYTLTGNATAVQYTPNGTRGEIEKISTHCIGCHSDRNNSSQPFGDAKSPNHYAWDGTSVAARYSQSATTTWGKYSTAKGANKRAAKAYSAHGNAGANQRGWNIVTGVDGAISNTSGSVNVQCYDCHNSHGSAIAGITSRYSSATGKQRGGILKDTTIAGSGYSVAYRPYSAGSMANKDKRSPGATLCLDCHMNQSADTTPWGYNATYGASQQVIGYWDSPFMGYTTAGFEQRYPFKKLNAMKGGHFGASSPLKSQASSKIDGLCTPCHDPHGVSPTLGANQQYAVPLLKGTFLTSPYREDTAPASNNRFTARPDLGDGLPYAIDQNTFGTGLITTVAGISETTGNTAAESQSAGLCLGCHGKESLTTATTPATPNAWKSKERIHETVKGWKSSSTTVKHNYSCSKCHTAHTSSALPRLMITNCLDGQHKGRTAWSDAKIDGSGSGQAICCAPVCTEIPYSFRKPGYADMNGGYGWCAAKGNWAVHGSGGGHIPGSWRSDVPGVGNFSVACHEGQTGVATDQAWNDVTQWHIYPAMAITSGPSSSVNTATGNNYKAIINWATSIPSTSIVNYGLDASYGNTLTGPVSVTNHTVTIEHLVNHSTYHYQVSSLASDGQQITTGDNTVAYLSTPPSVPWPNSKTSPVTCATSCPQTISWSGSADYDGGPVQYQAQVDTSSSFDSTNLQTSPWVSTTNWTATLAPNTSGQVWYYRARSRDGNHTLPEDPPSSWSNVLNFQILAGAPAAPAIGTATALSTTSIRWNFTDSADNETGFNLHDPANAVKATSATLNLSYLDEALLTANTQYTRHLHAYNALGDGPASGTASRYTLPLTPNVTADKTVATWYGTPDFTFTNSAGFGNGGVQYYRYAWDQSSTHTFTDTEPQWSSANLARSATADGSWYLHVKSFNGDDIPNGTKDYGPYYYDATPPTGLSLAAPLNGATDIPVKASLYAGAASDSGVGNVQYLFQVALDSDFTQELQSSGWNSSTTANFTLTADKSYFWRVKAKDGAGNETSFTSPWSFTTTANSAIWTNKGDFEANLATTGTATTRDKVVVSGAIPADNAVVTMQYASITMIASGNEHSLALLSDGSVWAWGRNDYGQIGNGTTNVTTTPVQIFPIGSGVIGVSAGAYHSLAVKTDGSVWAWGSSNSGQLGDGSSGSSAKKTTPVQVSGFGPGAGVISVAAGGIGNSIYIGGSHSLALKSDGSVWGWGYNANGQLGDNTTDTKVTPVQILGAGSGVVALAAGSYHSMALKSDGTVWSWGYNNSGQLGDNSTTQRLTPGQIPGANLSSGTIKIAAGNNYSLAVKSDGSAWSWGYGGYSQLGNPGSTPRVPTLITGMGPGAGAVSIAAAARHGLILKADGSVWGWGDNNYGQVGDGTNIDRSAPVQVVAPGAGITAVAAGGGPSPDAISFSIAIKSGSQLLAWGDNEYGQLGDGTTTYRVTPVQVTGLGIGSGATAIAAGGLHSMAVKADGPLTWGYNAFGELGDNSSTNRATPVQVSGMPAGTGITALAAGNYHSLALKGDGTVWGWGYNWYGQLGNGASGPSTNKSTPVQVTTLDNVIGVAANGYFSLAVKSDGSAWSWGYNYYGQLGDGTSADKSTPTQVSTLGPGSGVTAVAAGNDHSLALKSDGSVLAWGYNYYGQLGDNTTNTSNTPVQVYGLESGAGVTAIATGSNHSLAVKSDGSLWAWGYNSYGQLGNNSTNSSSIPVQILPAGSGVIAVAAGNAHSVALKSDGSVWAWGKNDLGQLGDGTTTQRKQPVKVVDAGSGIIALAAGLYHTVVLKNDGTVLSWGSNSYSQLGNGYTIYTATPTPNLLVGHYNSPGTIVGLRFDATNTVKWGAISWNAGMPANTAVKFRARGADNEGNLASVPWSTYYETSSAPANLTPSRWLEMEMTISTSNGVSTPTLGDCSITYSDYYSESTPPSGLDNAAPVNGAADLPTGTVISSTVASDGESGGVQYYFQIALDSGFSSGIQTSGWQAGTSFAPALSLNRTYYWRVKARDAARNETPYTATWSFATIYAPAAPTIGAGAALSTNSIRWNFSDTAYNEDGFKLHDPVQTVKVSSAAANLSYLDESGLLANTAYTRHVHSYNVAGDSIASADVTGYTLALGPNVTTDKSTGSWFNSQNVTFTNATGFGSGGLQQYRYVWDQNATYSFNDTEAAWSNATLTTTATAVGIWYLHVKGYNGDNVGSGTQDYGPFLIDFMAPTGLGNSTPANLVTNLPTTTVIEAVAATDSDSGSVQYYFQMAFDSGFTSGLQSSGWQSGTTYTPPLLNGKSYYWHVKSRDAAGNETPYTPTWQFTTEGASATWSTKGDFDTTTTRNNLVVSGTNSADDATVSNFFNTATAAAGSAHSLAVKPDGTVLAWGFNTYGQLGDNTTTPRNTPALVQGAALSSGVIAVAAGTYHSLALKSDGSVWGWGLNSVGELGDNSTTQRNLPVQVYGLGPGSGVIAIAAGGDHSLALKSDGSVWGWGYNYSGQLGDGTFSNQRIVPIKIFDAGSGVMAIAGGNSHSVALKSDGSLWIWGSNYQGEACNAAVVRQLTPAKIIDVNSGIIGIAAGTYHNLALKADGTVLACGYNSNGQLGDNSTTRRDSFVQVNGLGPNSGVNHIKAGRYHSVALKADGSALAWGYNMYGQVGDNSQTQRNVPTAVLNTGGANALLAVAAGGDHCMGIKSDLSMVVWGSDSSGQLGRGVSGLSKVPIANLVTSVKYPLYYTSPGTISKRFNAGAVVNWGALYWNGSTPANTSVKCRTRGASTEAGLASATWSGYYTTPVATITTAASQWLEVELTLESSDNLATPFVNDLTISYRP